MVRISRQTNIFNLIRNPESTIDDFKKLYELTPEKFTLKYEGKSVIEFAEQHNRNDLLVYLRTVPAAPAAPPAAEKPPFVRLKEAMEKGPKELKEVRKTVNIDSLTSAEKISLLEHILFKTRTPDTIIENLGIVYRMSDNTNYTILYTILMHTISKKLELLSKLIQIYRPNLNFIPEGNKYPLLYVLFYYSDRSKTYLYDISKLFLENGADPNAKIDYFQNALNVGYMYVLNKAFIDPNTSLYLNPQELIRYLRLFLEHGIDIDQSFGKSSMDQSFLYISMFMGTPQVFNFLIENGANVNAKDSKNISILYETIIYNKEGYVRTLIEKGADVNSNDRLPPKPILFHSIKEKRPYTIIKLLVDSGALKNNEIVTLVKENYTSDEAYYKPILTLLGEELPKTLQWSGFSRSDIEKFDLFFEAPYDWSCCPICLEYIERSAGCMYMSHNCSTRNHFYHKALYDTFSYRRYEGAPKLVEWCTVCGRITKSHKHYVLTAAQAPSVSMAPLKPEIQAQLDRGENVAFFDNANCIGFGGGGTEEKAARFRRMREYALELQDEVNKQEYDVIMKELIEEVWNAPLIRNKKIKKILENKRWNINVKEFPDNTRTTRNKNANVNAPNIPFQGTAPTIVEGDCIIFGEDEPANTRETNPKFQFHHERNGGIDHDGIYICQKDLAKAIEIKCAEFGLEDFGTCWFSPCKGILHPEEVKGIIPEPLYVEYRKKFNKKMAQRGGQKGRKTRKHTKQRGKQRGGNNNSNNNNRNNSPSILHELQDGVCTPPNWR